MDIENLQNEIDNIDKDIVSLLNKRMAISKKIAQTKVENNLPLRDVSKERQKMNEVIDMSEEDLKDYMSVLYSMIFDVTKSYQSTFIAKNSDITSNIENAMEKTDKIFPQHAKVACQGVEGANSQIACDKLFRNANITYYKSFEGVFKAIENGECRYGIVPVENSIAGSVNSAYDLMSKHNFKIVRSIRLKIDHNLLVKPGTKLEDIREIYSHEQAINQCSEFLGSLKDVKVIPCENTAIAAKRVSLSDRNDVAAIASRACISLYNLSSLKESIQNTDNNYTRFICISKELEIYPGASKTSVMLTLPHEPGSLYKILSRFYALGVNLIKLESRPLPNREFEFMFYFDLETSVYTKGLLSLLDELSMICDNFTYLGSYNEVI
ncbi:MAG: prephenate dehydratase [Lachnospiraceae bacterium]|nr:prephenate dehydratase [Lachnospiraceae bacterium]